ncbi:hypothetical protein WJX72_008444 [[Myrmecia] bisecta]|uniref:Uncharacterized protein n=1 Tax=[Myrmecia] bisecta TaxID=41462 RepID=A0AAW1PPD7_9CHLO
MAVDFGSEFIKVSVVKPGRTPISIVNNEMSKRRTSAQVAFIDGDRLLGEEAAALNVRYPDRVYAKSRDLLGKPAKHDSVQSMLNTAYLPYEVVEDAQRKTVSIKTHSGEQYSAEELVASILHYAKAITSAATEGAQILDAVISVPAFFGPAQRQALLDAAALVDLNVLGLINNHAAAALQFGIDRNWENRTERVILYDMGASSVEVALVKYSSFTVKEAGKTNTYSQFEVEDVTWAENLGAEKLDLILLEHFADEFNEKHLQGKSDMRRSSKAVAKLKRQVRRTKEILSANTEAPVNVEELHEGIDFRSRITRDEFEALAGDFFKQAAEPLTRLLERNSLTGADVEAVELLGGGSRVPKVKAALSEALGGRSLDMHLDADEAVVLGAALFAANLSTTFRLRKFGMADGATYPINFQLDENTKLAASEEATGNPFGPKSLLPFLKRLPAKRVVHLPNATSDRIAFTLAYDTDSDSPNGQLPPGVDSPIIGIFELSGVADVLEKHGETGKMSVHFRADVGGVLSVEKAECVINTVEMVEVEVPIREEKAANETKAEEAAKESLKTAGGEDDAEDNQDDTEAQAESTDGQSPDRPAEAEPAAGKKEDSKEEDNKGKQDKKGVKKEPVKTRTVTKEKKRTLRLPLKIGGPGFALPSLSDEQIKASRKVLAALNSKDEEKRDAARAKNDLEAYIITTRDKLESDDALAKVTTAAQRTAFQSQLTEMEDWLYSEGEDEKGPAFRKQLASLTKVGDPLAFRAGELNARPRAVKSAQQFVELTGKALNSWRETKPWINATELDDLAASVKDFDTWLKAELEKQGKLKDHDDPVLKSADVTSRLADLKKTFNKLKNRKKPKPPPAPAAANATANGTDAFNATKFQEMFNNSKIFNTSGGNVDEILEQLKKHMPNKGGESKGADKATKDAAAPEEELESHDEL